MNLRKRFASYLCGLVSHKDLKIIEKYKVVKQQRNVIGGRIFLRHLEVTTSCKWSCGRCGHTGVGDVTHLEHIKRTKA